MTFMTPDDIDTCCADALATEGSDPTTLARHAMERALRWTPTQQMGRRWPIGCVALEITQRCNLDCTLCYLSETSEFVHDLPLAELFRRAEMIHRYYGSNTDVQITGGEPTLRRRDELVAIVRKLRELGLRSTLMTNGIRATRSLLTELAVAGLSDVAFHVDTTQNRRGFGSEVELNVVRQEYIERTRGLGLSVLFNTSIHRGNFHEVAALTRYFRDNAAQVRTASFQLAAATGRGIDRARGEYISLDSVCKSIQIGAATSIDFRSMLIGHDQCNRYALCIAVNGRLYDVLDDRRFVARILDATAQIVLPRNAPGCASRNVLNWLVRHPRHLSAVMRWAIPRVWKARRDLIAARCHVSTLSFMIHNFMDSTGLEKDRIDACAFKVMTTDGPMSMCLHNAKRDHLITQPIRLPQAETDAHWQPLTGCCGPALTTTYPIKVHQNGWRRLKGTARVRFDALRRRTADSAVGSIAPHERSKDSIG